MHPESTVKGRCGTEKKVFIRKEISEPAASAPTLARTCTNHVFASLDQKTCIYDLIGICLCGLFKRTLVNSEGYTLEKNLNPNSKEFGWTGVGTHRITRATMPPPYIL